MEEKKLPKVDLEKKRPLGLLTGLVIALILLFVALQWRIPKVTVDQRTNSVAVKEEMIPITVQQEKTAPLKSKNGEATLPLPKTNNYAQVEEMDNPYTEESHTVIISSHYSVQYSQIEEPPKEESTQVTGVSEYLPEFPGGQSALLAFLRRNIRYPAAAQENGVQGRVIVQFVVNRDGTVTDPVVLRSVCSVLDREAVRVVSSMPRWRPGMQGGRSIRTTYTIPVTFKLKY